MASRWRRQAREFLMRYISELTRAMTMLAEHHNAIFLGQSILAGGTAMHQTFGGVLREKCVEFPVAEDMQMGLAIGIALAGGFPITVFPRVNFLLLAVNQLVNHLDKLPLYSPYRPKVIIRTAVATPTTLDPGPQHLGDYTPALRLMLKTVEVVELNRAKDIVEQYHWAMHRTDNVSTLLVEKMELYD